MALQGNPFIFTAAQSQVIRIQFHVTKDYFYKTNNAALTRCEVRDADVLEQVQVAGEGCGGKEEHGDNNGKGKPWSRNGHCACPCLCEYNGHVSNVSLLLLVALNGMLHGRKIWIVFIGGGEEIESDVSAKVCHV